MGKKGLAMSNRKIEWQEWVNGLVFCYGCGKLARGGPKGTGPKGWGVLYQPHAETEPGLHVCSPACSQAVMDAMKKGPIYEPLKMADAFPLMPADVKSSMLEDAEKYRTLVEVFGKDEGAQLYERYRDKVERDKGDSK